MEKIYVIIKIGKTAQETEDKLNEYQKNGYRVVCSYSQDNLHLILEKKW